LKLTVTKFKQVGVAIVQVKNVAKLWTQSANQHIKRAGSRHRAVIGDRSQALPVWKG